MVRIAWEDVNITNDVIEVKVLRSKRSGPKEPMTMFLTDQILVDCVQLYVSKYSEVVYKLKYT